MHELGDETAQPPQLPLVESQGAAMSRITSAVVAVLVQQTSFGVGWTTSQRVPHAVGNGDVKHRVVELADQPN